MNKQTHTDKELKDMSADAAKKVAYSYVMVKPEEVDALIARGANKSNNDHPKFHVYGVSAISQFYKNGNPRSKPVVHSDYKFTYVDALLLVREYVTNGYSHISLYYQYGIIDINIEAEILFLEGLDTTSTAHIPKVYNDSRNYQVKSGGEWVTAWVNAYDPITGTYFVTHIDQSNTYYCRITVRGDDIQIHPHYSLKRNEEIVLLFQRGDEPAFWREGYRFDFYKDHRLPRFHDTFMGSEHQWSDSRWWRIKSREQWESEKAAGIERQVIDTLIRENAK